MHFSQMVAFKISAIASEPSQHGDDSGAIMWVRPSTAIACVAAVFVRCCIAGGASTPREQPGQPSAAVLGFAPAWLGNDLESATVLHLVIKCKPSFRVDPVPLHLEPEKLHTRL